MNARSERLNYMHVPMMTTQVRYMRIGVIAAFLAMTFGTFQFFPGASLLKEAWIVTLAAFLILPYLYWKARIGRVSMFELYILLIIVAIPLLSALAAWREFGQPLLYGVLSQRNNMLAASALLLIFSFKHNMVTLKDVNSALLFLAWGTLGLYLFMSLFLNPASYAHYGSGFVSGGNVGTYAFKFRTEFLVFGFFYYAFIGFRHKSTRHWFLALPFLVFLVVDGGRSLLVSTAASFLFFVWRWGSFSRLVTYVPKVLFFGLASMIILYVNNAEYITEYASKFNAAFTVVISGEEADDVSANARIIEVAIALPYITKNWIIGNGDISNQWNGGYANVIGGYFYPSDIGIIGVLYMYGLIGTLLLLMQFIFAYRYSKSIARYGISSPLIDAIKGYLLYFLIHSVVTGRFAHYSEISLFFIALLGCSLWSRRKHMNSFNAEYSRALS